MFSAFPFPCFCLRAGWRGWWWVHSEAETARGGGRLSTGKPHITQQFVLKSRQGGFNHCLEFLMHGLHWWDCVQGDCKLQCGPAGAAGKSSGAFVLPRGHLWCSHKPRLDLLGKGHFTYLDINIWSTCEVVADWWPFQLLLLQFSSCAPIRLEKKIYLFSTACLTHLGKNLHSLI